MRVDANGPYSLDRSRVDRRCFRQADHAGARPWGIIVTILIGMAGALVGGFITQGLFGLRGGGFISTIIVAIIGAIIPLALYRLIAGRRRA